MVVSVLTEAVPHPERRTTFREAIVKCKKRLVKAGYMPTTVLFIVIMIGQEEDKDAFRSELRRDIELLDVLFCPNNVFEDIDWLEPTVRSLETWLLDTLSACMVKMERAQV